MFLDLRKKIRKNILRHKEIIDLFNMYCMGMMNGVFPLSSVANIGMPRSIFSVGFLLKDLV